MLSSSLSRISLCMFIATASHIGCGWSGPPALLTLDAPCPPLDRMSVAQHDRAFSPPLDDDGALCLIEPGHLVARHSLERTSSIFKRYKLHYSSHEWTVVEESQHTLRLIRADHEVLVRFIYGTGVVQTDLWVQERHPS